MVKPKNKDNNQTVVDKNKDLDNQDKGKLDPPDPDKTLKELGYKSWPEVVKAITESKKFAGELSTKLGDVRVEKKEMTKMLQDAVKALESVTEPDKGDTGGPTAEQKKRFMQYWMQDPVAVMSDVAEKAVGEKLTKLDEALQRVEKIIQEKDVYEKNPEIKGLPESLRRIVVSDPTGKAIKEAKELLAKVAESDKVATDKEKEFTEFRELIKKSKTGVPLKPGPAVKIISDEDEYKKEMEDAVKKKDKARIAQLITSRLKL